MTHLNFWPDFEEYIIKLLAFQFSDEMLFRKTSYHFFRGCFFVSCQFISCCDLHSRKCFDLIITEYPKPQKAVD